MSNEFTPPAPLQTAVLFLVFNRPDTTAQVFEAIRSARPPRLYVAADGPREGREGEAERVAKVRQIATAVDWPCEINTLFRDNNLGCKHAVSSAITWFFQHEEQGIILEDDCLPHPDFFHFCEENLNHYKDNSRIMAITGVNFQNGQVRGKASYYFSKYNHVWGWATWRRAWSTYDREMTFWPTWKQSESWSNLHAKKVERRYWTKLFDQTFNNKIDTWDYQWTASVWFHGGLTITPNVNLISNIGFGPDSTHTKSSDSHLANIKTNKLENISHTETISYDTAADNYVFDNAFEGKYLTFPRNLVRLAKKIIRKLKLLMTDYLSNASKKN